MLEYAKQNRLLSKRTTSTMARKHIHKKNVKPNAKNNKTEKQISDKIGKLLTFPINVGSFIIKRVDMSFALSLLHISTYMVKFIFRAR